MEAEKPRRDQDDCKARGFRWKVCSRVTFGSRVLVKERLSKRLLRAIEGRATNIPVDTPGLRGMGGGGKGGGSHRMRRSAPGPEAPGSRDFVSSAARRHGDRTMETECGKAGTVDLGQAAD